LLETYIALLRGINVGGKNSLPMRDLAQICQAVGCQDVKTYIQSGNVIVHADDERADSLSARLSAGILEHSGLRVPVVLLTRQELAEVAQGNPYLAQGADPAALHAMFLADAASPTALQQLDYERSPGDSYRVLGRTIYLNCPNGLARTKLTNDYFDRTLQTTSTGRNWRTVLKLLELAHAM